MNNINHYFIWVMGFEVVYPGSTLGSPFQKFGIDNYDSIGRVFGISNHSYWMIKKNLL